MAEPALLPFWPHYVIAWAMGAAVPFLWLLVYVSGPLGARPEFAFVLAVMTFGLAVTAGAWSPVSMATAASCLAGVIVCSVVWGETHDPPPCPGDANLMARCGHIGPGGFVMVGMLVAVLPVLLGSMFNVPRRRRADKELAESGPMLP